MKFPSQIFLVLVTGIGFYDRDMSKLSMVMSPGYLMLYALATL